MTREWKPGDVVRIKGHGVDSTAIVTNNGSFAWVSARGGNPHPVSMCHPSWGGEVRPLVVIDPEDEEQVRHLAGLVAQRVEPGGWPTNLDLADALREFANPLPPKPEEPTGLGAVVEDADGGRWVRVDFMGATPWTFSGAGLFGDKGWRKWADVPAVSVLSSGVEADA